VSWRPQARRLAGHGYQLPVDHHLPLEHVQPVDGEPEDLALPHASARREGDQGAELLGRGRGQQSHLLGGDEDDLASLELRQPRPLARVGREGTVADRMIGDTMLCKTPMVAGA
jgi:hypothetical protein